MRITLHKFAPPRVHDELLRAHSTTAGAVTRQRFRRRRQRVPRRRRLDRRCPQQLRVRPAADLRPAEFDAKGLRTDRSAFVDNARRLALLLCRDELDRVIRDQIVRFIPLAHDPAVLEGDAAPECRGFKRRQPAGQHCFKRLGARDAWRAVHGTLLAVLDAAGETGLLRPVARQPVHVERIRLDSLLR